MNSNSHRNRIHFPALNPPELQDPVIEEALARKLVNSKQVADAWLKRKIMYRMGEHHPVWRWLAEHKDVNGEEIYRIATEVYDYKRLTIPADELKAFLQRIIPCFSEDQWKTMLRVGLIPVKRNTQRGISSLWNFAANDPTSRHIHILAQQYVGKNYELYQADRSLLTTLFAEVYLTKMELPRRLTPDSSARN